MSYIYVQLKVCNEMVAEQSTREWITAEYNDQLKTVVPEKDKETILVKRSRIGFLVNILPSHGYLIVNYIDIFVEVICAFTMHTCLIKRQCTSCNLPVLKTIVHKAGI